MNKKNRSRTRQSRQPRKPLTPAEIDAALARGAQASQNDARRRRTRVLIDASRAVLGTYHQAVERDFERARKIIDEVAAWTDGGPEPECVTRWRALVDGGLFELDARGLEHTAAGHAMQAEYDRDYDLEFRLTGSAVEHVLGHAAGTGGALPVELHVFRNAVTSMAGEHAHLSRRMLAAMDQVLGESEARS